MDFHIETSNVEKKTVALLKFYALVYEVRMRKSGFALTGAEKLNIEPFFFQSVKLVHEDSTNKFIRKIYVIQKAIRLSNCTIKSFIEREMKSASIIVISQKWYRKFLAYEFEHFDSFFFLNSFPLACFTR